jgi:hypothetical protein
MSKASLARAAAAKKKSSTTRSEFELQFSTLFSDLSDVYGRTKLLTEMLQSSRHLRSSAEAFEAAIMLKNALRLFADATSHLRS